MGTGSTVCPVTWLRPAPFDGTPVSLRAHIEAIVQVMRGEGRLWLGPFDPPATLPPGFEQTALVVPTSGSTGAAKAVALSRDALFASQDATANLLGGHGFWLPLLPPTHIAGVQVIARAIRTAQTLDADPLGALPTELPDLSEGFTAGMFARWAAPSLKAARDAGLPAFTSLVPTQLARVVQDPSADGARARALLPRFDAVLVGGAATPAQIRVKARAAKLRLTYGSSETAGGCVYDGAALTGTHLALEDPHQPGQPADGEGRLLVRTGSLALGYLRPDGSGSQVGFRETPDGRALVTSDLASLDADGRLTVIGRADDVIITGGRKVLPQDVEAMIEASLLLRGQVAQAVVVGVPDPEWGQRVEALVVPAGTAVAAPEELHALVRSALRTLGAPGHQIPKRVHAVDELPLLGIGKIDRARAAEIAHELSGSAPT